MSTLDPKHHLQDNLKVFIDKNTGLFSTNQWIKIYSKLTEGTFTMTPAVQYATRWFFNYGLGDDILKNLKIIWPGWGEKLEEKQLILPSNISAVDQKAFQENRVLQTIDTEADTIGEFALAKCPNLQKVSCTNISVLNGYVFDDDPNLSQVTFSNKLISCDRSAFGIPRGSYAHLVLNILYNGPKKEFRKIKFLGGYGNNNIISLEEFLDCRPDLNVICDDGMFKSSKK